MSLQSNYFSLICEELSHFGKVCLEINIRKIHRISQWSPFDLRSESGMNVIGRK